MGLHRQQRLALCLFVGFGLISTHAMAQEPETSTELSQSELSQSELSQPPADASLNPESAIRLNIDAIQPQTQDSITHDYRFWGNADEIIVIYLDWPGLQPQLSLYDAAGVQVHNRLPYRVTTIPAEQGGIHRAFQLPSTGEYRLVLTRAGFDPDFPIPLMAVDEFDFRLRVRVASTYEQLSIQADQLSRDGQFTESIAVLGEIIALYPHLPAPYLWRVTAYTQAAMADLDLDHPVFQASSIEASLQALYGLFQVQPLPVQSTILSDLRQAAQNHSDLVSSDLVSNEGMNLGESTPDLLMLIVALLETGEVSPVLIDLLESVE